MLAKAFAVYYQCSHLFLFNVHFCVHTQAPLGLAVYPAWVSLRVSVNLWGWKITLLPLLPCHHELPGEFLACWPPVGWYFTWCIGPHYNNIDLCFAECRSRASNRLQGDSGSVTRSLPISWDVCRDFSVPVLNLSPQEPQAGVPQQPQDKLDRVPVAFPSIIKIHKHSSTTRTVSNKLLFGSSLNNLWALRHRSWLHRQKGSQNRIRSCRFGKCPSAQQRLNTWGLIFHCNLTARSKV